MSSVYWEILSSVKAALLQLDSLAAVPVVIRKRPFYSREHGDTLPMVCVSGLTESVAELTFENQALVDYPIIVAIFQTKGATLQSETEYRWQLDRREEVRQALHQPALDGAPSVMAVLYEASPPFNFQGLDQHLDLSVQQFTYRSQEPRSV